MGFFTKLKNWFTGKGWTENEITEEPPKPSYEEVEQQQYQTQQPQQTEETETKQTQELREPIKLPQKTEQQKEIETAIRKYESKPKVKQIEKGINEDGENRINVSQNQFGDMSNLKPQYTKVFTENAKLNDPDILNVLFQGRQQLQHRFTAEIKVDVDGKYANTLEVRGILIEHTGMTYNFVNVGMQIDSPPQLDKLLQELGSAFESNFGAINSGLKTTNMHKGQITNIQIEVTFA